AYRHARILADAGHDARTLFLDPNDKPAVAVPYAFLPTSPVMRGLGKLPVIGDRLHNRRLAAMPIIDSAAPGLPVNHVLLDGRVERRALTTKHILAAPE